MAVDASSRYALIAVQGPQALGVLQSLTAVDLGAMKLLVHSRRSRERVGHHFPDRYTGEDGFEIFVPPRTPTASGSASWKRGRSVDLVACGLGARDTLRLEAAMRLHGNDIDESTTVLEADLNWIVGWKKPDFIGADALRAQKANGVTRKLVGFEMTERGIARQGHDVFIGNDRVGVVTSGTQTPFLKKAIGLAYVPTAHAATDTELDVDIRGRRTRRVSCRCRSISVRSNHGEGRNGVSDWLQLHEGPRVD